MLELVRVNELPSCYVRPIALRAYGEIGVNPLKNPVDVYLACWEWGKYLGEEALAEGVDVCVSSWNRLAPNTLPTLAKAGANYMNSQLIKMEAITNGYSEGIALDTAGYVSEGSGENIFVVRDGKILTPPLGRLGAAGNHARFGDPTGAATWGFRWWRRWCRARCCTSPTRSSSPARRRRLRPSGRSTVSRLEKDTAGPIAEKLQKEFFAIVNGTKHDRHGWLSVVNAPKPVGVRKRVPVAARPGLATSPEICPPSIAPQPNSILCSGSDEETPDVFA